MVGAGATTCGLERAAGQGDRVGQFAICSGVVPQQPPTAAPPDPRNGGRRSSGIQANRDKSAARRPPWASALGCTIKGSEVRRTARSTAPKPVGPCPAVQSHATGGGMSPANGASIRSTAPAGRLIVPTITNDRIYGTLGSRRIVAAHASSQAIRLGLKQDHVGPAGHQVPHLFDDDVVPCRDTATAWATGQWSRRRWPLGRVGHLAGQPAARWISPTLSAKPNFWSVIRLAPRCWLSGRPLRRWRSRRGCGG